MKPIRKYLCKSCANNTDPPFILAGIHQSCNSCGSFENIAKYEKQGDKWIVYIPIHYGVL